MHAGRAGAACRPWKPFILRLTAALQNLPLYKGTVYRGIGAKVREDLYAPDQIIVWHAFSSSSSSSSVAEGFLGTEGKPSTLFVIESRTARLISPLSRFEHEAEALFPPNAMFRVLGQIPLGVQQLLQQAMKRDLSTVTCYNLKEVTDFESGLTQSEQEHLEPLVSWLQLSRVRQRGEPYSADPRVVRVSDKGTKILFLDCLRRYPGALRLLAHQYGAPQVLYVALVGLRAYQGQRWVSKTASDVLLDLLGRIRDETYYDCARYFGVVSDPNKLCACGTCKRAELSRHVTMWECLNAPEGDRDGAAPEHYECDNCVQVGGLDVPPRVPGGGCAWGVGGAIGRPEDCSARGGGDMDARRRRGGGWRNGVPCRALCFV